MKEYALYKGDNLLGIGTIKELAKQQNVKPETIEFYKYPAYQRRCGNRKILILLEDE